MVHHHSVLVRHIFDLRGAAPAATATAATQQSSKVSAEDADVETAATHRLRDDHLGHHPVDVELRHIAGPQPSDHHADADVIRHGLTDRGFGDVHVFQLTPVGEATRVGSHVSNERVVELPDGGVLESLEQLRLVPARVDGFPRISKITDDSALTHQVEPHFAHEARGKRIDRVLDRVHPGVVGPLGERVDQAPAEAELDDQVHVARAEGTTLFLPVANPLEGAELPAPELLNDGVGLELNPHRLRNLHDMGVERDARHGKARADPKVVHTEPPRVTPLIEVLPHPVVDCRIVAGDHPPEPGVDRQTLPSLGDAREVGDEVGDVPTRPEGLEHTRGRHSREPVVLVGVGHVASDFCPNQDDDRRDGDHHPQD